jgi:hypothetical protein
MSVEELREELQKTKDNFYIPGSGKPGESGRGGKNQMKMLND